jgi:thiol:disulfide interchange protein DsbD
LLGTVVTMLILAAILLALRAGGTAVGWGFQLQSPLVIAFLALIILGAALNLLGVFEVGLSMQRAGEISIERGAFARAALTGALSIIVATPCAAPFMAGAIGYALVQPPAVALVIFFARPWFRGAVQSYLLFPALGKWLPRPGAWMNTLKRGLAFPMFGAFGWLVWVLAQQAGTTALAAILAASVVLSFAAWLYGMAQQRRFAGKRHLALFAVTAVLILAVIVPLPSVIKNGAPVQTAAHIEEVKWSPQNVADNRGHGKAIFVNFTASWCITCQVNEKTSLTTQAVKRRWRARARSIWWPTRPNLMPILMMQ